MIVQSRQINKQSEIGASQLFLSLFLLLLAFFIFLNSISSYQKGKTFRVVESVRASFPSIVEDAKRTRLKNPQVAPIPVTIFRQLDEAFLFLFPNLNLEHIAQTGEAKVDIPLSKLFENNKDIARVELNLLLGRLSQLLIQAEKKNPLSTEILFGYKKSIENQFLDKVTLDRAARIMQEMVANDIPRGFTAVGLEPGHANFLRFKFRSRKILNENKFKANQNE